MPSISSNRAEDSAMIVKISSPNRSTIFLCVDRTDASVAALVAEVERVYRAAATDLPALAAEGAGNADGEHMIRMFRQPVSAQ